MDYPGWEDGRHCACGLIGTDAEWRSRAVRAEVAEQIAEERMLFSYDASLAAGP